MSPLAAVEALFELPAFLTGSFNLAKFLFSPSYRKKVYERWEQQTQMKTVGEVIGGIFGVIVFLILIAMGVAYLVQVISAPN